MSSFSGEDRVALWDKEGSQTQLTGVGKMFTRAASPPLSPLSIPHHGIPQQCPSEEDTPPSAPLAPQLAFGLQPLRFPARSQPHQGLAEHKCEPMVTKGSWPFPWGSLTSSDCQKWDKSGELTLAGTPGDTYRDRYGREKGLGKLLGMSLLLKGKNTAVALGITVLNLQLCFSPFGAFPELPVSGTQGLCWGASIPVNHHSCFSGIEEIRPTERTL